MKDGGSSCVAALALVPAATDEDDDDEDESVALHPSRLTMTPEVCSESGLNVEALALLLSQQPLSLYENPWQLASAAHLEQHSLVLLALTSPWSGPCRHTNTELGQRCVGCGPITRCVVYRLTLKEQRIGYTQSVDA
jgi:hypothetical protein